MRVVHQIGIVVLLLMLGIAPAVACMIPAAEMTPEERLCCRMMSNDCGQMEMPASHSCCQKTPQSLHASALVEKSVTLYPVVVLELWLTAAERAKNNPAFGASLQRTVHPPPNDSSASISILRV